MRVGLVVHDLVESVGHGRYTLALADRLSATHEVSVFANRASRTTDGSWRFHKVWAWRMSALATVYTFPIGLRAHAEALRGFDVIHSQGYCGGRPNLVTAHICTAAYLKSLENASFRTRLSLALMARAEEHFYRGYNGQIIAISKKIADELRAFYACAGKIHVLPHGVDTSRFNSANRQVGRRTVRRELGIEDKYTVALYIGDLTKAHTNLKRLAAVVPDVQFLIVTRSKAYRWEAANVHFAPPTDDIERYYAAADAFVFPTTYDAFGMVVLEAMASGLPVFTSDRAGAAELISNGDTGFVQPLEDWVEATATQLKRPDKLADAGRKAEARAQGCSWDSVVRNTADIYEETAGAVKDADTPVRN